MPVTEMKFLEHFKPPCRVLITRLLIGRRGEEGMNGDRCHAISARNYNPRVDWPVGQHGIMLDRSIAEPPILIANCFRPTVLHRVACRRGRSTTWRGSTQRCTVQGLQIVRLARVPLHCNAGHVSLIPFVVSGSTRFRSSPIANDVPEFMDRWDLISRNWFFHAFFRLLISLPLSPLFSFR